MASSINHINEIILLAATRASRALLYFASNRVFDKRQPALSGKCVASSLSDAACHLKLEEL